MHCKTAECYDTIGDRAIITPSFTRNPILFLERISAVLVGLGPGPVIQVASDETRLKSIKLLGNSAQGPGEDSGLKETLYGLSSSLIQILNRIPEVNLFKLRLNLTPIDGFDLLIREIWYQRVPR